MSQYQAASSIPPFLAGSSTTAGLMRAHDWSRSALGVSETWPAPLRTMAGIILHAETPMFVAWGEDLRLLYNDAYQEILGGKHPAALGCPLPQVWPEIWEEIRPLIEQSLGGQAVHRENQPFILRRRGFDEACWFTYSYLPIQDDCGRVAGIYGSLTETTAEVLSRTNRLHETERLRRLFHLSPSMVAVVSGPNHVFELANATYLQAIGRNDVIGLPAREVLPELVAQGFINLLDKVYASGEPFIGRAVPIRFPASAGVPAAERFMDFIYQPITEANGKVSGIFAEGVDVTHMVNAAQADAKFRTFFEQGSYFAGLMALDGTLMEANRLTLEACGFAREDVVGKKFWECGWWARSQELAQWVRQASAEAAAGRTSRQETPYFTADGRERLIDLTLSPVTADKGQVIFIAPTGIDITERKLVEQRLKLLDAIAEATQEAIEPRAIMLASARLLGEYLDVTRCAYASVEPDNDTFTIHEDWTRTGIATTAGIYSLDLFGPRAASELRGGRTLVIRDVDRELQPAEGADMFNAIGIQAIITCPLVKAGQLVAMMAVHEARPRNWSAEEITLLEQIVERSWAHIERVRAAEALRTSETHLASLLEQTAAGIAETDLSGKFLQVNQRYCEILGRSREDTLQYRMQDLTHPADVPHNLVLFERMVKTGTPFSLEKRYVRPDGSAIWTEVTVSMIRGGQSADSILAVVLDISERKRAEEELRKADRRKDEFLAMLAHELRNPLAPIAAAADLLQLAYLDAAQVQHTSQIIARQVRHITGLVDDLLDVSRVTRGLVALDNQVLDAKRVVADAVEQVRPLIQSRRHHLAIQVPCEPGFVLGDQKRLVQVLANLLNNAAKYTPDGGDLALSMSVQEHDLVFEVCDNGIGMSAELAARAFDLFLQGERSSDRSQGGLGIGLALVKSLAELHGGQVTASSEGPGKGSAFTVRLPRVAPAAQSAQTLAMPAHASATLLKILIVDDNADAATMLALMAQTMGHQVVVEHDAAGALEQAQRIDPDVCILDIGLPGMDGNALAQALRRLPQTAGSVLIAVTGYGQEQDRRASVAAGFDHHFVKPVDTATLTGLLQSISKRH